MKPMAISGSGQPMLRRVASSSATMRMEPITTSMAGVADAEGQVLEDVGDVQHRRGDGQRQQPVEPGHAAGRVQRCWAGLLQQRVAVREDQEDQPQHEGQVHAAVRDFLQQPEARRVVVEQRQQRSAARPPAWPPWPSAAESASRGRTSAPVPAGSCRRAVQWSWQLWVSGQTKRGGRLGRPVRGPSGRGDLLQQAGFLVEALGARVERDARALDGVFLGDELALGVAGGQLLLRGVAVQRLGDLRTPCWRRPCRW
jgi:hypothetical protein